MAGALEGLADLAAIGRGARMEASAVETLVRETIGSGAIVTETVQDGLRVAIKETSFPITTFVKNLLTEESGMMDLLKTNMSEASYKELSTALMKARGVESLSQEALTMLNGVRAPLEDLDLTVQTLKTAESSEVMFKAILEDSASLSSKNAELLQRYEKLSAELSAASAAKSEVRISGSTFKYVLAGGAIITAYSVLGEVAKQNSGCYIFSKKHSTNSRVRPLSREDSDLEIGTQCTECELNDETKNSNKYKLFRNGTDFCDTNLCRLESLKPPFNNPNDYSMSCIKLNRLDVLADLTKDASESIGSVAGSIASVIVKTIAPAAAALGLTYLGFKYSFNYLSGNVSGMTRGAPDYYPQRKKSKKNESKS